MIGLGVRTNKINAGGATSPPANTVAPTVSGTAVVGQTLTTTNGTWTNSPSSYTYQWYRVASAISGATNSTYTLVQADAGNTSNIKCVVTATNAGGSASADSNTVARVLDTDTNTYISGLTLTSGEINSYNTFFIGMRSGGYNTLIDRLHVYAGATQSASNKSLYGGYTAIPVNSPTWTRKVGYTHTGTSYIRTGWIPATNGVNFTRNTHTVQVYVERATTTNVILTGDFDGGTKSHYINWKNTGGIDVSDYGSVMVDAFTGTTTANKLFAVQRTSSTSVTNYRDASTNTISNTTVDNLQSIEWYDSGRNLSGSVQLPMGSGDKSVYGINAGSTISVSAVNTLIQSLISSL